MPQELIYQILLKRLIQLIQNLIYDFVKKVNNINTTDTSNVIGKADYQRKINEVENKMNNHDHTEHITT